MKPLYQRLASTVAARLNCEESCNFEWFGKHEMRAEEMVKEEMPSGSGFDSGTKIDFDRSTREKLVFYTSFHHMDENGYDGWTEHTVTVRASLQFGIDIKISGNDRNEIKEYIHQVFSSALENLK